MLTAEIMDLLDSTIVNVAGPTLAEKLGASSTDLQWIIGGYTLSLGAGLVLGGRLGDRFGRRNMFLFGLIGFTLASLMCSISGSPEQLIAFRVVQGFLGAMLLPQGFGLIRASFPADQYASAFAVFGPVFGLGGIIGPVIGGGIIQANILDLGWRSVFLVNVPLGVAAAIIAWRILPRTPGDKSIKIDLFGTAVIMASSVALIYPLIQGQVEGWPLWTWLCLAGSLVGFYLFVVQQRWSASRGGTALIDARIFKQRAYTVGVSSIAFFFAGMTGIYLIVTLFLQIGHSFTAGDAGLWNIPIALGSAIGGTLSGAVLSEKLGRGVLQLGVVVQAVGAGLLWFAVSAFTDFNIWQYVPGMVVAGVGTGLVVAALFDSILSTVDDQLVGSASGVLSAIQSIAASLGVAIFGTVFFEAVKGGDIVASLTNSLSVDFSILAGFAVLTFFFPKKKAETDFSI